MYIALLVVAFHAEPVSSWHAVEADAICMVWSIACIAEQELILVILSAADRTWPVDLFFLFLFLDPSKRIEIGDLFLIFDFVFLDRWTCSRS